MSIGAQIRQSFPKPSSPQLRGMAWASFASSLGSTFQVFAFTYVTYATTESALATVMVGVSFAVGFGLVAVRAGEIARVYDHRRVVVLVSIAKVVIYGAILALDLLDDLTLAAILISSAASGVSSSIQYPCWQELLQEFSAKGKLDETNALFTSLYSVASVAGALTGGFALDAFGPAPLFAFNVLSYLPTIIIVGRLPSSKESLANARKRAAAKASASARQARAAIRASGSVRRAVLFIALLELLAWPLVSLMPKIAAEVGTQAEIYGILLASFYAGSATVAVMLRRWKKSNPYSHIIRVSMMASGAALLIAGVVGFAPLSTGLTLFGLAIVIGAAGLGFATAQSVLGAITQLGVAEKVEGEVLAIFALVMLFCGNLGAMVEGQLADSLEIWWLPLVSGALIVLAMFVAWWGHQFRSLDEAEPDSPGDSDLAVRHAEGAGHGETAAFHLRLRRPLSAGTSESRRGDSNP